MNVYYVGLDVHKASICIAVLNADGKLVMESVIETSAATILDFLKGLRGQVHVTFEEGTHATWLYDVLKKTKVTVIVCDPRKNRLLQDGHLVGQGRRPQTSTASAGRAALAGLPR